MAMQKLYIHITGAGILALMACILLSGCGKKKEDPFDPYAQARPVRIMTLQGTTQEWVKSYPAKTEAKDTVDAAFEVAGKIIELPIQRGMPVEKDQVLAKLDPRDYENDFAAKKAEFNKAQAELNRYRELYENDAVSLQDLEIKERDRNVAEANMQISEKAYQDTILKAPFAGVVAVKYVDNFQSVLAKQEIARIQNNEAIEVIIYVPERDVAVGQASDIMFAKAVFDAFPGKTFDLQLKEFETQADPVTQTFKVKFILPRPKEIQVLPGMSANVTVGVRPKEGQAPPSSFLIPSAAVSAGPDGKAYAWVVDKDETVHQRGIQLGAVSGTESIEVQGGLEPGERIVTAGVFHLREGMKVRPKAADEKLVE